MKYSLNLIKSFVKLEQPDEEVIDAVSRKIAEVESVRDYQPAYANLLVAEITEAKDHPDADKLGVYQVNLGKQSVQVVAGDKTLQEGDLVAYIPPGEIVPSTYFDEEPFEIKKTILRGEESNGMLASCRELDISDEHEGVLKLDQGQVGQPVSELYGLADKVFEIENKSITHRPDLFGHLGMAREVAAVLGVKFSSPDFFASEEQAEPRGSELKLSVTSKHVERFTLQAVFDVEVKPSDLYKQATLNKLGVRPINNLVDATNWAWLMYAQPMHVFDYDKVKAISPGVQINVYDSKGGEKIEMLDGSTVETVGEEVVIAAGDVPISLAGTMGGSSTEVDESSRNVIFEAASFDMYRTRKTSMQHGLFTDAVTVFSRGQDAHKPGIIQAHLVQEMNLADRVKAYSDFGKAKQKSQVEVSIDKINRLLGREIPIGEAARLLNNAEIVTEITDGELKVQPPFWRKDLNIAEDIVEEVGRLYGFDELGFSLPVREVRAPQSESVIAFKEDLRGRLSCLGANEVLTYNFVSSKLMAKANHPTEHLFKIRNALSPKLEYMRDSLVPNLLEKSQINFKQKFSKFVLFELGKAHSKNLMDAELPIEQHKLALAAVDSKDSYYLLKNYLDELFADLGLSVEYGKMGKSNFLHTGRSAELLVKRKLLGYIGEPTLPVKQAFKLKSVAVAELDLEVLRELAEGKSYVPGSPYPSSYKDLTVNLPDQISYAEARLVISDFFKERNVDHVISFKGIYRGDDMEQSRNITFALELYSYKKTLTNKEINVHMQALADQLAEKLNAKIV